MANNKIVMYLCISGNNLIFFENDHIFFTSLYEKFFALKVFSSDYLQQYGYLMRVILKSDLDYIVNSTIKQIEDNVIKIPTNFKNKEDCIQRIQKDCIKRFELVSQFERILIFLGNKEVPIDTFLELMIERTLTALNGRFFQIQHELEQFFLYYDKIDHDVLYKNQSRIGEQNKKNRKCRFCNKTEGDGARFQKNAHAISEGLGNKKIFLNDECDECNTWFGHHIEPDIINFYKPQLCLCGIKGKKGQHQFTNNDVEIIQLAGGIISCIPKQNFESANIYRALCKFAISILDERQVKNLNQILENLQDTISWIKQEKELDMLPKLFLLPINHPLTEPELTVFIKKEENLIQESVPSIVGMFSLGYTTIFFILPENHYDEENAKKNEKYDTEWFLGFAKLYGFQRIPSTILDCSKNADKKRKSILDFVKNNPIVLEKQYRSIKTKISL